MSREKRCADRMIHILGVTYKKDISDSRESPAIEVIKLLTGLGAQVTYSDPYVPSIQVEGHRMEALPLTPAMLASCDVAMIITNHTSFDYAEIIRNAPLVYDTRNATEGMKAKNLVRL